MHDIGTVVIPGDILHKSGRLSPVEFGQIKRHTLAGAAMLEGGTPSSCVPLGRLPSPTTRTGTALATREARRRKVPSSDALPPLRTSLMPSPRIAPIGVPCPGQAALEIRRLSGSKFDPAVVDAFEAGRDEIPLIAQRFVEAPGTLH